MKGRTLICITIVLGVSMLQDVRGGKTVTDKKLKNWTEKKGDVYDNQMNFGEVDLKDNVELKKHGNELEDLLEVIQYVITNTINNREFRMFLIKRFLHNYVKDASEYLDKVKELKRSMDPKAAKKDDEKDKAMKSQ
ncbi:ACYPI43360 protein [Aphis craccivora]|uniref:ACYPI43360 protein n=1 Tax=Aphis craccivora TaxID=307492 RepID=A0A6G0ZR71_APHCR|nr:ACYPI43360 protein [Aphis craccivora]